MPWMLLTPIFVLLLVAAGDSAAQSEEEGLAGAYGGEEFVSIATGRSQPLPQAPAVASVITAADIEAIGATDLDQVLETVPGLHVSNSVVGLNPIYIIRGIASQFNPEVLVLINGIPITNVFVGNRGQVWGGMPVNDIARIEVIRGPGSAIYGADAFSGVVNIVTKTRQDINGTELGGRAGSFDTYDSWLLHGGRWGGLDAALALELHKTEGFKEVIDADAQTTFDGIFGTRASLAPGPVNTERHNIDARVDLARGLWRLRLGYQGRRDEGLGSGVAQALDPQGHGDSDRVNADLTYHNPRVTNNWDVTAQLSYFDTNAIARQVLFPPGAFGGAFPQGVIGNPDVFERTARAGVSAFYTGFSRHRVRLGAGYVFSDLYKVRETKNFFLDANGLPVPVPQQTVIDVSETAPFIRPHSRNDYYLFLQDEWDFAPDWNLTAGVRYDDYSDFGGTVNPRLALVWQMRYNLTGKLLYGHAFLAPSFAEEFNINNPVALGNPNLKPETIDTVELAFDYQLGDTVRTGLNVFYYKIHDLIRFVPDPAPATSSTAQNAGGQTGRGLEWETSWQATKYLRLSGNYAFQYSTDDTTGSDAGNAPRNHVYLRSDWRFRPDWSLNTQLNWVGGRERVAGDTRPDVKNYGTVDLILRRKKIVERWDVAVSIRNLFDADVREPTPAPGLIPDDLPLAGRSFFAELRYRF